MKFPSTIALGWLGVSLSTQASTILDSVSAPGITAQMYRDEAALYPSVGKVTGQGFSGSGVLISDHWVLTAGHISLSKKGGTFAIGGTNYTIQSSITHPQFSFSGPSYDLGLLYLSTPVTATIAAATMIRFASPADILGKEATWVGYGFTGTGLTGAQTPIELRAFTNIIDVIGSHSEYGLPATSFVADFDKPDGTTKTPASSATATRLEGNVASGDSGGGVFVTEGENRYLLGINSYTGGFAPSMNSKYGSLSGAVNLDLFYPWITEKTGISPIPEPGCGWFCWLAPGFLLRRRRGSPRP